jgi:hypothetical protein
MVHRLSESNNSTTKQIRKNILPGYLNLRSSPVQFRINFNSLEDRYSPLRKSCLKWFLKECYL